MDQGKEEGLGCDQLQGGYSALDAGLPNNYISSMQFCTNNTLMQLPNLNHSFALRRHIRIKSSKLPPDFFSHQPTYRYSPLPLSDRNIAADISNRTIRTPSFEGKRRSSVGHSVEGQERKVETARPSLGKAQNSHDLISGILSTSNNLRRAFRKPSIDLKQGYSVDMGDRQMLRLPKILNRGHIKKI